MAHEVFIGYSRLDSEAAEAVERYLADQGIGCYRDVTSIPGSEEWVKAITQAIRGCHAYVAIISKNSVESQHVLLELTFGKKHKKPFVSVLLSDNFRLPDEVDFLLGNRQYIFAKPSLESVLPEIAEATHRMVDRSKYVTAYGDEDSVRSRATYKHDVDFSVDSLGLPLGKWKGGSASILGGAYVFCSSPGNYLGHRLNSLPISSEFEVEARISKTAGPTSEWYGFEFGADWPGDYYQFLLNDTGSLRIARHLNRNWTDLFHRESVRQFRTGGDPNTLKVVRRDRRFHVFVNGLHAATLDDFEIRTGQLGLTLGRGITVEFTELQIAGLDLEAVLKKALDHWNQLEMIEATPLLSYAASYDPACRISGMFLDAGHMLLEIRPDRRESVLVVIGTPASAQFHDRIPAERLREEINRRGRDHPHRWAGIVTDTAVLDDTLYRQCPVIAVGGPVVNKLTATLMTDLPADTASTPRVSIHHNISGGDKQVAVWGPDAKDTSDAVDVFISSGLLDRFLKMIWTYSQPPLHDPV